jgi:DNA-directed RNA polymerase specialized sigma24 family protein
MTPRERENPSTGSASAASETEIRWSEASLFVRRRLRHELPISSHGNIDDLVQESLVRLLRAVRREPVENLEALMTEIARRTAIDSLRRRTRWMALVRDDEIALETAPDPRARADQLGDPVERLQFVVLEFFEARRARCRELAVAYFAEQDWKAVAAARGRTHAAVRKQWSLCLALLRSAARTDPSLLMDWAQDE